MAVEKLNRHELIEVIYKKQGILSQVAREMRVSLPTVYNYRDKYATVAAAIVSARNTFDVELVDEGEIKLREAVRNGEAWAVKYVLSTKGKRRGYVERQEITGADGGGVDINVKLSSAIKKAYGND